ncbi:hypothetical protein H0H93_008290 [Arthromyces matolae]|nr:hypothetical protein H0H93_008290 [Arthromyces matolae]
MKATLLFTSFILLGIGIASPVPRDATIPQLRSCDNDLNELCVVGRESDNPSPGAHPAPNIFHSVSALAKRADPNPSHNQPAGVEYSFGTRRGKDVTLAAFLPQKMDNLDGLPKDLDILDVNKLLEIAKDISQTNQSGKSKSFTMIRKVLDDRNVIEREIKFLKHNRRIEGGRYSSLQVPKLPLRGTDNEKFRKELISMIRNSHNQLRVAVNARNTSFFKWRRLQISPLKNAHNPDLTVPGSGTKPTSGESSTKSSGAEDVTLSKPPVNMDSPSIQPVTSSSDTFNHKVDANQDPYLVEMLKDIDAYIPPSQNKSVTSSGQGNVVGTGSLTLKDDSSRYTDVDV